MTGPPPEPAALARRAPTATVSSLKSQDSTEHLICKSPQDKPKQTTEISVTSRSVEARSDGKKSGRKLVVFLGLGQVLLGALLVGAGAFAVVKGAALSRVGAGLWAGCIAVVAGVVGVLAGVTDCYGLHNVNGSGLLTAFLALSLLCLACGNSAAVLAATGLHRDSLRSPPVAHTSFEDEMQAWTPVLTNIALLIIAVVHCMVCVITIYHLSKRVCPCFRGKQPYDHNQFDPTFKAVQPYVVNVDETKVQDAERTTNHELCKELEIKLQGETLKRKKEETLEYGSSNSKEKLVTKWLGRHQSVLSTGAATTGRIQRPKGVRKPRKLPPGPVVFFPAHPASTLGRMPPPRLAVPPRYATLPPRPAPYAPVYYPVHDARIRRRRSARGVERKRREHTRERDMQLARSLERSERVHRKRRADPNHITDADLQRTYTGLDRAYAEQFIAVCAETRHAAEQHDSLASTSAASGTTHSHELA